MTLDEAIKHAEEVADFCEDSASRYDMNDPFESHMACKDGECASEHRQLAEWLKELKAYQEAFEEICGLSQVWEEGAGINKCCRIIKGKLMEVNADESNSNLGKE